MPEFSQIGWAQGHSPDVQGRKEGELQPHPMEDGLEGQIYGGMVRYPKDVCLCGILCFEVESVLPVRPLHRQRHIYLLRVLEPL